MDEILHLLQHNLLYVFKYGKYNNCKKRLNRQVIGINVNTTYPQLITYQFQNIILICVTLFTPALKSYLSSVYQYFNEYQYY